MTASTYTPPEVATGKIVGFHRKSQKGQSYIGLFYRAPDGTLHSLSVFENESRDKPGKFYFRGMGDTFQEQEQKEEAEACQEQKQEEEAEA